MAEQQMWNYSSYVYDENKTKQKNKNKNEILWRVQEG